jgi:hypothetical protein
MDHLTPGEEAMIGALAREVRDGDWAAGRTRSPADLPETPALDAKTRSLLYGPVKEKLARAYPHFAARLQILLC